MTAALNVNQATVACLHAGESDKITQQPLMYKRENGDCEENFLEKSGCGKHNCRSHGKFIFETTQRIGKLGAYEIYWDLECTFWGRNS